MAQSTQSNETIRKLAFGEDKTFETELRRRVNEHFKQSGKSQQGDWRMVLKTVVILSWFSASYLLLVFVARNIWQGLVLDFLLGLSLAGIGFSIQHDGGHKAYSKRPWVNRLTALTLDMIGGSSYVWRWKHAVVHHHYTNITGYDTDIERGGIGRFSPYQKWRPIYRWQHLYFWPLYGLLAIKWELVDDFFNVFTRRLGPHKIPRPHGFELGTFIAGKLFFITWALGIPLLFHPVGAVVFHYAVVASFLGLFISVVFLLPHCVNESEFPMPRADTGRIESPWAVHQASVTLDFSRHSKVLTWFLGGLNYHLEHHLFPVICHVHYPAIAGVVEKTCREFGVKYAQHKSFGAGIASHYRWLRRMGSPDLKA